MRGTEVDTMSGEFRFVNYAAMTVLEMMKLVPTAEEKYKLLIEFIRSINPDYALSLNIQCSTPEKRARIVSDAETRSWIPLVIGNIKDPLEIVEFIDKVQKDYKSVTQGIDDETNQT